MPVMHHGSPERFRVVDLVDGATSPTLTGHIAVLGELADDALYRALGEADLDSDISHANLGISREAEEDVGVVGDEGPTRGQFEHENLRSG